MQYPVQRKRKGRALVVSGGGTTLRNILQRIAAGELNAAFKLVISSNPSVGGLRFAAEASIPVRMLRITDYPTPEAYRDAVFQPCREAGIQLVVTGGFAKHVLIPSDFEHRVMNIHPGLFPAFCGQGSDGHHVHQAALDCGVKLSCGTVHFADNQYDHGPIILQRAVPVLDDDTPETVAARIFQQECAAYPETIRLFAEGRLQVVGRRVRIV